MVIVLMIVLYVGWDELFMSDHCFWPIMLISNEIINMRSTISRTSLVYYIILYYIILYYIILYYYIHFTMQNLYLLEFLAEAFRCHVHDF